MSSKIDCVIIGYNDVDFNDYASAQKAMRKSSGAYRDVQHNSVLLGGRRVNYMELLNRCFADGSDGDPRLNAFEVPSLGVTYLTSFLRQRSFNVEMISFFNYGRDRLAEILADGPRTVAITTTYYVDIRPIVGIVEFVRRHSPETRIIVGGPHVYNVACDADRQGQDFLFQSIGADVYIADSQGEATLARVLTALRDGGDLAPIPNLVYTRDNQSFGRTGREIEDNDMNGDVVDFSLLPEEQIYRHPVYLRTARSCPFSCSFCNFPTMAGKHVITELDVLERQFDELKARGVRDLIFTDDTFNVPLPRFKNLLRMMIRKQYNFSWISFFRCSNADDVAFDLMAESGCSAVFLGIESGDQDILNYMRKFADIEKYKTGIRKLKERGILTYASIITGFPGETRQTVMNTVEFLEESAPDLYNVQLYYHDVRTPIHGQAEEFDIQGAGYSWSHTSMDWQEAADWVDYQFTHVGSSVPITLYNFSMWCIPYLERKGLSPNDFKRFAGVARDFLVDGFEEIDVEPDFAAELASGELAEIFSRDRLAAGG